MSDDQKLWDLLGRSPRPDAPPFFTARVMRAIEPRRQETPLWFSALLRWLAPATIAALLFLAIAPPTAQEDNSTLADSDLTALDLVEMLSPEDYQVLTSAGWPYDNTLLTGTF